MITLQQVRDWYKGHDEITDLKVEKDKADPTLININFKYTPPPFVTVDFKWPL